MDGNTQEPDAQADLPTSPFHYEGKPAAAGQTDALSEDDRSTVSGFLGDTKALNVPAVESVFFDSILSQWEAVLLVMFSKTKKRKLYTEPPLEVNALWNA